MRVSLPVTVLLRCKARATVEQGVQGDVGPFALQGRNQDGSHELWCRDGHWREDRSIHHSDIVGLYDADGHVHPLTNHFLP